MFVSRHYFRGKILQPVLPQSKSLLIRYMVYHFLKTGKLIPLHGNDPEDAKVMYNALCSISENVANNSVTKIDAADCGTAFRFLIPLLATKNGKWLLTGSKGLLQRPVDPLIDVLLQVGAQIQKQADNSLFIEGRILQVRQLLVNCQKSSQFASALLLMQSTLGWEELLIQPQIPFSNSYIEMTRKVIAQYNNSGLPSCCENDWSAAIFWYAWALLNDVNYIVLLNLSLKSWQNDSIIARWFAKWGINSIPDGKNIILTTHRQEIPTSIVLDLAQNIDLAPILSALAVLLPTKMTLLHVNNLNSKESQRGNALIEAFSPLCECYYAGDNKLIINGLLKKQPPSLPLYFHAHNDHRLVMAFALLCSRYDIIIEGGETAIQKSYPAFWNKNIEK